MMRWRCGTMTAAVILVLSTSAGPARAEVFRDIGYGLGYAGFNIEGSRNYLSGGYDFLLNQNFLGNPLNLGPGDLTLAGPISLSASMGTCPLNTYDISLRTAFTGSSAASPLSYVLNYDLGSQATQVAGTLFVDANLSFNQLGFYDVDLMYSSRQDVNRLGRFSDSNDQYDSDLGPISVSGNIYADVLALLTDPLFEATGTQNIFASFSGDGGISRLLEAFSGDALLQLATGGLAADDGLFAQPDAKILAALDGQTGPQSAENAEAQSRAYNPVVPEPTVLVLMLLGAPFVFGRPLRRWHAGR